MKTGEAGQRVTIQVRTETDDGRNGVTESWADVAPRRRAARVKPLAGRDLERARQIDPRISHEVTLYYWRTYRTDLVGGRAQLLYHPSSEDADNRTFEIVSPPIDLDERHEEIQMLCREAA